MGRDEASKWIPDAVLVQRALTGDTAGFDGLVLRYRALVLNLAHSILGNWDEAEDAAQQAFLDALSSLPGLHDPTKFGAWLGTIARRRAMRNRDSMPHTVEFCESTVYPSQTNHWIPESDDLRELVRASLGELSSRNRTILVLHYLDGYSCKEIGARMGIPVGTVMRVLHDSRASLRKSMGLPTRRDHEMTVATKAKGTQTGPRRLIWWINGSNGPGEMMRSLLPQSICLSVNKTALTARQIADVVQADVGYVREAIEPLVKEGLLIATPHDHYSTGFVAMDAEDWLHMVAGLREQGTRLADMLVPHLAALEDAWSQSTQPRKGYAWDQGIWPTLAVLVCNMGVSRYSAADGDAPLHDGGGRYWLGGHEAVTDGQTRWITGFNCWNGDGEDLNYGYFWTWGLDRTAFLHFSIEERKTLSILGTTSASIDDIAARACLLVEDIRNAAARLLEMGIVLGGSDALSLAFPVFTTPDSEVLAPAVDKVASALCNDILIPETTNVMAILKRMGYGDVDGQFGAWRSWLQSIIAGECLHELLERRVLPDPGAPVRAGFGLIGWFGSPRLTSWNRYA